MSLAVPAVVAGLVVLALARHGPTPDRVRSLIVRRASPPARRAGFEVIGSWIRRAARRPADPVADRRLALAVLIGAAAVVIEPMAGIAAGATTWLASWWRARRERTRVAQQVVDELPDVVDLLALAVDSGLGPRLGVEAVARRGEGPVSEALRSACAEVARGVRLADALERLPSELGEVVRPVTTALVAAERYGVPLLPALAQVSADLRAVRRRRADEAVRRLTVKLVFPLVMCTLPAFALLTVIPLLAGSLRSLRL